MLHEESNQFLTVVSQRTKQYNSSLVDSKWKLKFAENKYIGFYNQVTVLQQKVSNLETGNKAINEKNRKLTEDNSDLHTNCDYFQGLLDDSEDIQVYDRSKNTYSNELVECAMNLTMLLLQEVCDQS